MRFRCQGPEVVQAGSGKSEVIQVHSKGSMNLTGNWVGGEGWVGRKLFGMGGLSLPKLVV